MIKNKSILITGAAGFIGSHLFETLIQENNYIVVIDNFNTYYAGKEEQFNELTKNLEISKNYDLIKGDLLDRSVFKEIKCEIDFIFHLAAQAGIRYSIEHASEVTQNNVISSLNIFEYASDYNVKKVICASSSSVYGNPVYTPVDENHPKNPISPYGVSKLVGEIYADFYHREYDLSPTSLRFHTVYGPRGRPDMAIRKFFDLILQDKEIVIFGDGEQLRDFTYVSDIVNGLILAAESNKSSGEIFNLGASNPITVNTLVNKMYEIAGSKTKRISYSEKKQGDVEMTHSNIEKAKKMLNYSPKTNIDNGLRKTFEWQLKSFAESKKNK